MIDSEDTTLWTEIERAAVQRFRSEVCERSQNIDPDDELDWFDLSLGFLLACSVQLDRALALAAWLRYTAHYFEAPEIMID